MGNNYNSFESPEDRGRYAREISWLLGENNIDWRAFPSAMKPEVFIRPQSPPEENIRNISRISLQIKDGKINLGVSGYHPYWAKDVRNILEDKGYVYHIKEDKEGNQIGRWWLVKSLYNIDSLVSEFKDIEPLLHEKIFN
jgi:hypothetical protein